MGEYADMHVDQMLALDMDGAYDDEDGCSGGHSYEYNTAFRHLAHDGIQHETAKAVLVSITMGKLSGSVWYPKSKSVVGKDTVFAQNWLHDKKRVELKRQQVN